MYKYIGLLLIFSFNFPIIYGQEKSPDMIKLNQVVQDFGDAIASKDSIKFKKLFFHDKVAFTGKMSKKSEWSIKKDYADFEGLAVSDCSKFIKEICLSDKSSVENFYNINTNTDGAIATISFDYSFFAGGKMIQWGNEKWNLVFADNVWLITDVIYSIRFPDIEKFPFHKEAKDTKDKG